MTSKEKHSHSEKKGLKKLKLVKPDSNQPIGLWLFVFFLNLFGLVGFWYLKSHDIDLYAFRGGG
ncbi:MULTISPECIES: hypothetical protein [Prochlorococcus]|uniref:hypothetical protein n=1 Tax=Prochlorococcus TaxID=1218 RepID=UPI00053372C6|nr:MULTISPECIES: hypothetical protein [Prochlorococcus]KGG12681.1 hypothetical protein EV05_1898 [Prochlorococcus sp. MIT 0601]